MAELLNLLLAAALFISIPFILALVPSIFIKSILLVIVVVMFIKIFRADQQRKRTLDINNSLVVDQRMRELIKMAVKDNFRFEISSSSLTFYILLSGAFGVVLIATWAKNENSGYLIGGLLLIIYSLSILFKQLSAIGKPLLTVTQRGMSVKNSGTILWSEINSIVLHEIKRRGSTQFHLLVVSVSNCERVAETRSWIVNLFHRLGFKTKPSIVIILNSNNESPEVVFRLCKLLWDDALGKPMEFSRVSTF